MSAGDTEHSSWKKKEGRSSTENSVREIVASASHLGLDCACISDAPQKQHSAFTGMFGACHKEKYAYSRTKVKTVREIGGARSKNVLEAVATWPCHRRQFEQPLEKKQSLSASSGPLTYILERILRDE